jgi:hypothetical protein
MGWFRKKSPQQVRSVSRRNTDEYPGDWITVPFRFAEAVRVSIHTIGTQPEVPAEIRLWIAQWLQAYNSQLVMYMKEYYGPHILPLLDQITRDVMPDDPAESDDADDLNDLGGEPWDRWESQFEEGGGDGRGNGA